VRGFDFVSGSPASAYRAERCTFETWEIEFAAKDIEQVEVIALYPPSGANAVVGKLGILVGGIPALDYLIKPFRLLIGSIKLQPFSLNDVS
jgi:hypothetical protein